MAEESNYTEDNIRSLDWKEHIRLRPGMYIGKLGDGGAYDDGIYIMLKEVVDNCIDEFVMGHGKTIDISIKDKQVRVRDYGRGIPLGKMIDAVSKMNTGGKYDTKAFKKSVIKARIDGPSGPTSVDPSFVFVCDSKTGSITFTLIPPTIPERTSLAS